MNKLLKIIVLMIGALIAPSVIAEEMVNLVCVKPVDDAWLEGITPWYQKMCNQYPDYCDDYEEAKKDREDCSTAEFAWKTIYTINKSLLNQSEPQPIEQVNWSCKTRTFTAGGIVKKGFLLASPSYLQLGDKEDTLNFNIDRKTLEAGYNYKCTIEEIDTSSNAI
jgi:hypothetical protein